MIKASRDGGQVHVPQIVRPIRLHNRAGIAGSVLEITKSDEDMKKYYFYIARCSDDTLYSGSCTNIQKREERHNSGEGAKYTKYRRPVTIVYHEDYDTLKEAMSRETQVKKWRRDKKEMLIDKTPDEGSTHHIR